MPSRSDLGDVASLFTQGSAFTSSAQQLLRRSSESSFQLWGLSTPGSRRAFFQHYTSIQPRCYLTLLFVYVHRHDIRHQPAFIVSNVFFFFSLPVLRADLETYIYIYTTEHCERGRGGEDEKWWGRGIHGVFLFLHFSSCCVEGRDDWRLQRFCVMMKDRKKQERGATGAAPADLLFRSGAG